MGIDRRAVKHMPKDIDIETVDIRRRRAEDIFRREQLDAVIHLNILHDPRTPQAQHHDFNINGTQKIAKLCAQNNVPKFVVLSSTNVYGPRADNDQFLKEDAPLLGSQNFGAIRDLVALDMLCSTFFWRYPEVETVILRPAHIIGRINNAATRYLRMQRPWTLLGYDPMMQLIHAEDVVSAIERALIPGIRGVYNIAGPPPVPLSYVLDRLGRQPKRQLEPLARAALDIAWSLKLSDWPTPELDHLKYVCMVDDSLARRELGYAHDYGFDDIVRELNRPAPRPHTPTTRE